MVSTADLPLHGGKAPRWLFRRMVALADGIFMVMVDEFGTTEVLRRLADPFWFQALSCVLGFDWHSSGTTTVTMGALRMALKPERHGLAVVGGKGRTGKKTPGDITALAESGFIVDGMADELIEVSRMVAKVDSSLVQDGYSIYHHNLILDSGGNWTVVQQGMNTEKCYARRYQWYNIPEEMFLYDPHSAILSDSRESDVLNLSSAESEENRKTTVDVVRDLTSLRNDIARLRAMLKGNHTLFDFTTTPMERRHLTMPLHINWETMRRIYEFHPRNYEELLGIRGVGSSTIRALALVSELIYGSPASWKDPMKYTFTVGGKDGVPYPVDTDAMDEVIEIIENGIKSSAASDKEKYRALRRARELIPEDLRKSSPPWKKRV